VFTGSKIVGGSSFIFKPIGQQFAGSAGLKFFPRKAKQAIPTGILALPILADGFHGYFSA